MTLFDFDRRPLPDWHPNGQLLKYQCSKGGLSTAIKAGVPEWVLFTQSGHGQQKAARAYVALDSPAFLFDTWSAFNL